MSNIQKAIQSLGSSTSKLRSPSLMNSFTPFIYSNRSMNCVNSSPMPITILSRFKHSKRQVKRLFLKHPAAIRRAEQNNSLPQTLLQPDTPTYNTVFESKGLSNGWSAPPSLDNVVKTDELARIQNYTASLPFQIQRTGNKPKGAVGFLPVYSDVRLGGTKHTTIIKKVSGDHTIFLKELKAALSISPNDSQAIRTRASGTVFEISGNRTREVKRWLAGLGF